MPAAKNSAGPVDGFAWLLLRLSNSIPHRPGIAIGLSLASSRFPRNRPSATLNAAIVPPKRLPIRRSWLKNPKSWGASATPHGAFKTSGDVLKPLHKPSVDAEHIDEAAFFAAIVVIGAGLLRVLLSVGYYYVISHRLNVIRRKTGWESIVIETLFGRTNAVEVGVEFLDAILREVGCQQEVVSVFLDQSESR